MKRFNVPINEPIEESETGRWVLAEEALRWEKLAETMEGQVSELGVARLELEKLRALRDIDTDAVTVALKAAADAQAELKSLRASLDGLSDATPEQWAKLQADLDAARRSAWKVFGQHVKGLALLAEVMKSGVSAGLITEIGAYLAESLAMPKRELLDLAAANAEVERLRAELAAEEDAGRRMQKGARELMDLKEAELVAANAQAERWRRGYEAESLISAGHFGTIQGQATQLATAKALVSDLATFALSRLDYRRLSASDQALFDELHARAHLAGQTAAPCTRTPAEQAVLDAARAVPDKALHTPITYAEELFPLCDAIQRWKREGK